MSEMDRLSEIGGPSGFRMPCRPQTTMSNVQLIYAVTSIAVHIGGHGGSVTEVSLIS